LPAHSKWGSTPGKGRPSSCIYLMLRQERNEKSVLERDAALGNHDTGPI